MVGVQEHKGLWWLQSDEGRKLYGTLTIDNGAAALELIGDFGHRLISEDRAQTAFSYHLAEQPRIVGQSTDGKPITLEGHQAAPHTMNLPGMTVATYQREVALIGREFAEGEEVSFDRIAIRLSDLNEWTQVTGFRGHMEFEELPQGGHSSNAIEVRYDAPDDIEIELPRGEKMLLRFRGTSRGIGGGSTDVSLSQHAALWLSFPGRVSLERVFERVSQVRNFLSLAVGRPVSVLSVAGYRDDHVAEAGTPLPIEVFWQLPRNPEPPERKRLPFEMLFTFSDIAADAAVVMKHWFAKQDRLEPVFNLFFGVRHHSGLPLEVRFLTYAQAIETYDFRRRRRPGTWTLAQRVEAVCDQSRTVSKQIIGPDSDDRDAFIEAFKIARNYYTHYNPKHEKSVARGAALLALFVQLQALIEMSLLYQLGFSRRAIGGILARTRRYDQIRHFKAIAAEETSTGR